MKRIYLSPPHQSGLEREFIEDAVASNWIAPLGPHVDAFEVEIAAEVGREHAVALSSGTAALHLALRMVGVERGDEVICSTLTFAASAFAIRYLGAQPVFVDSDPVSWNMDPELLAEELAEMERGGRRPRAVVVVDLYGQCADFGPILEVCGRYGVPVIEDAAEALGGSYQGQPAGSFGTMAVLSFNGNKIITSSGGGMLLTSDGRQAEEARFLATQARDPAPHYEHSTVGYNYRLSNVLAALGRGQLRVLKQYVDARRRINKYYRQALGDLPGVQFMGEAPGCRSTFWLTCLTIDESRLGAGRDTFLEALAAQNIEARPVWKPMHLQPVFQEYRVRGGNVADGLFERGLCLPSGSSMTDENLARVVTAFRGAVP